MTREHAHRRPGLFALIAAALSVAVHVWLARGVFVPIAMSAAVEYVFVSASAGSFVAIALAAITLVLFGHVLVRRFAARLGAQPPLLSWDDVAWFRSIWDGPIILKGIQTVADAVLAANAGVDAIALSNHGGRQLDSAPAPLDLIAPVADAVGGRVEIYCDGGIRRGSDIVKAVAAGATACMAGRAYLYALGAAGETGVDRVLAMLDSDVRRTMALIGASTVADLGRDLLANS